MGCAAIIWERIMYTVGGGPVGTPALTRAIREFGEQAKKQMDETGSLAGFEGKFTDDSSGGGSVTVTVSALGSAAYDASAGKDDTFLAYTLSTTLPDGTADGVGSGSSTTIRSDQEIDAFIANFQNTAKSQTFASFLYGTPEEIASVSPQSAPAASEGTAAGPASAGAPSEFFAKLQEQKTASDRLIGLLQQFLDGVGNRSKRDAAQTKNTQEAGTREGTAVRTRLAQFAKTDVTA